MSGIEKAMIFAAGLGTRMRPLTLETPKPLVKVNGKALLDYSLDIARKAGIKEIIVNTHYLANQVKKHVKKMKDVTLSNEKELLETGGGVKKVIKEFDGQPFFTMNSDVILVDNKNQMLKKMAEAFDAEKMDALLLLHPIRAAIGYEGDGDFDLGENNQLLKTHNKLKKYVFTGVQILNPKLFDNSPEGPFSLNIFYKNSVQVDGHLNRIYGMVNEGGWLHIGTPEGIVLAERYLNR